MGRLEKVSGLVATRINGNSIRGNKTYESWLKSVTKEDILQYANQFGYEVCKGTKLDMIESLRRFEERAMGIGA